MTDIEARFIDIHAAADLISVGAIEVSEYTREIREACHDGSLKIRLTPATGHPTRYFEHEDGKLTEKSAPLSAIACEFSSIADAGKAVDAVWSLYLKTAQALSEENSGCSIECHWLSDPLPRIFSNLGDRYVAVKFFALVARKPAAGTEGDAICGAGSPYEDAPSLQTGCALDKGHEGPHQDGDYMWKDEPERPEPTAHTKAVIASTAEYVGLTADEKTRFVGCLLAVGLEIVPTAQLESLKQSHAALVEALKEHISDGFHEGPRSVVLRKALDTAKKVQP